MIKLILIIFIVTNTIAIRFNYLLPIYQIQCFHQSVEKDSRFQIAIKGESSQYYLHVVEHQPIHEDSRTTDAQYKYYSAFANSSTVITFCIGNLAQGAIYFDIQFYHGMYLQDAFESQVQGRQLQDLADRWAQMLKMVESNYQIYSNHMSSRRISNDRLTVILTLMVAIIIIGTIIVKCIYYNKIVKYLKEKKVV